MYEYNGDLINRRVNAFFFPGFVAVLTITFSIFMDMLLVGRMVGSMAMAAVSLSMPVTFFFNMVYMCFGTGGEILVASAKGAREPQRADALFSLTMILVLIMSAIIAAGGSLFSYPIANMLDKGRQEMTPLIAQYLRIIFLGSPLLLIVMSLTPFIKADAMPRLSAGIVIFSNIANIISKIVYMGPLKMGITGAALGTVTGYGAGTALMCVCYIFNRRRRVLNFVMPKPDQWKESVNIFLTGLPSSLGWGLSAVTSGLGNAIVLSVAGTKGMAALTAASSCTATFASSFRHASPMAIVPLVGALFGERDWWSMIQTTKRVLYICLIGTGLFTILFEAFPRQILSGFGIKDPEIMSIAVTALRVYAVTMLFPVIIKIITTYYQTTGRKAFTIMLSAGNEVIGLAVRWVCCGAFGITGFWIAPWIDSFIVLAIIFAYAKYIERTTADKIPAYHGNFLIHERSQDFAEKFTLASKEDDANGFAGVIREFAEKNGFARKTAEQAGELVKKAALEIIRKNGAKGKSIDVMAFVWKGGIVAKLRDDGPAFPKGPDKDKHIGHAAIMGYNDTFVHIKPDSAEACAAGQTA